MRGCWGFSDPKSPGLPLGTVSRIGHDWGLNSDGRYCSWAVLAPMGVRSTVSSARARADAVLLAQVECRGDQESGRRLAVGGATSEQPRSPPDSWLGGRGLTGALPAAHTRSWPAARPGCSGRGRRRRAAERSRGLPAPSGTAGGDRLSGPRPPPSLSIPRGAAAPPRGAAPAPTGATGTVPRRPSRGAPSLPRPPTARVPRPAPSALFPRCPDPLTPGYPGRPGPPESSPAAVPSPTHPLAPLEGDRGPRRPLQHRGTP